MTALRIAVLAPFAPPSVRGNAITVERIARGVRARGVELRVWDRSVARPASIEAEVGDYRPALIHAFHAYRVGALGVRLARRAGVPLVVTITGTDANQDLVDSTRAAAVRRVLDAATCVVVFHDSIAARVASAVPTVAGRIAVIPQSAWLPDDSRFDLEDTWALPADRVLFLFPAGIRPVKKPLMPLPAFDRLVERYPAVRLLYAGPVIDAASGRALRRALATRPWARHVGAVPHGAMASLLGSVDVVINASESEGGMANSVLEAMAAGLPVLASNIEGNRSLVDDGVTGFLFDDVDSLEKSAARLADCRRLRQQLGAAGRAVVESRYPPEREIDGYAALYRQLTAGGG